MWKKVPLKVKLVILALLCTVGIGIVVYTAISNGKLFYKNTNAGNSNAKKTISSDAQGKSTVDKTKLEAQAKAKQEEQEKAIEALYLEGYKNFSDGDYYGAIDKEEQVLAQDSNNYKALSLKGIALCRSTSSNYDLGMQAMDAALVIKPDYAYGIFSKAEAYRLYSKYSDALNWYDKDLQMENYVWSYYGKACVYSMEGDTPNAINNLKTAIGMKEEAKSFAQKDLSFANIKDSKDFQQLVK